MKNLGKLSAAALAIAATAPMAAHAATISGWNTDNVVLGGPVSGTATDASVVYDRTLPDANAATNGQIYYAAPEAGDPGLRVSNTGYTTGQGTFDGCILASSTAECNSGFQSGKRFKQQLTDTGPVDLVFDVTTTDSDSLYQVFHRIVNLSGQKLESFSVQLGTGVGSGFQASTDGDGLAFSSSVELGPNNEAAFSQFPFGLFGSTEQPNPNPNFTLGGFFDTADRSGFDLNSPNEDTLTSDGFYGRYGAIFGDWLDQSMAPDGLLWDFDGVSDPLVMAWDNGLGWEVRRGIDDSLDGVMGTLSAKDVYSLDESLWETYAYDDIADIEEFLKGVMLEQDSIEDLANLNLNYAIALGSNFTGSSFTLRVDTNPAAVPLPAAAPLLLAGLGALGFARRRRASRKA